MKDFKNIIHIPSSEVTEVVQAPSSDVRRIEMVEMQTHYDWKGLIQRIREHLTSYEDEFFKLTAFPRSKRMLSVGTIYVDDHDLLVYDADPADPELKFPTKTIRDCKTGMWVVSVEVDEHNSLRKLVLNNSSKRPVFGNLRIIKYCQYRFLFRVDAGEVAVMSASLDLGKAEEKRDGLFSNYDTGLIVHTGIDYGRYFDAYYHRDKCGLMDQIIIARDFLISA